MAQKQLKKYELAIKDFSEAIRLKPDYAYAFFHRAETWSLLYLFGEARNDYEDGLKYSADERARDELRQCIAKIEQYASDALRYSARVQLNPKMTENYFGRALCYVYQGRYDQARSDFQHIVSLCPGDDFCKGYLERCDRMHFGYGERKEY